MLKDKLSLIDLRSICRESDKVECIVYLFDQGARGERLEWIKLGMACLEGGEASHRRDYWRLKAYLGPDGPGRDVPTDFEHDSAYAISLPLIAVRIDSISYHVTSVRAFIDPTLGGYDESFHVPGPGYDPCKHEKAEECEYEHCEKPHMLVPYMPPFNVALYKLVRGKEVEIRFYAKALLDEESEDADDKEDEAPEESAPA